jgi:hypothetical protein
MINKRVCIPHLIVIPRQHFHEVSSNNACECQISYRRMSAADDIARNERFLGDGEDPIPPRIIRCLLLEHIYLLCRSVAF